MADKDNVEITDNEACSVELDNVCDLLNDCDLMLDDDEYEEAIEQVEQAQHRLEAIHTYLVAKKAD